MFRLEDGSIGADSRMSDVRRFARLHGVPGVCAEIERSKPKRSRGVALRLASRPADAMAEFSGAIKIAEATGDDRLLATALGGLGAALMDQEEFARAQPVLRRSLALFEKSAGPDSLETGEAANNLAMAYRKTGELAQAQAQLERALPLMEAHLNSSSVEMEIAFNNMFDVLAEQNHWDQAELYLKRALAIGAALPESPQFADVKENLALLLSHRAHYRQAAEAMAAAIAIEEQADDRARLAKSLDTYAAYLKKSGQKSEAQRVEDRARQIRHSGS